MIWVTLSTENVCLWAPGIPAKGWFKCCGRAGWVVFVSGTCRRHPGCASAARVTAEHTRWHSTARASRLRVHMGQESGLGSPGPSLQGPHTRLQSRCWSGLWVHRGSSAEGHASGLRVVGCARSTWAVGRPAGLSLLPLPPVACSSLLSRRLVSFSQPGSVSPRRLTEHAHTYPRLPRHLTHNSREDSPRVWSWIPRIRG